jgi:hypothetical protein
MTLKTGSDGPAFGVSWFNPLTGGYGSAVRYTQFLDAGKRQSHWLPTGLTMAKVRAGDTEGYECVNAGENVPGVVWVPKR